MDLFRTYFEYGTSIRHSLPSDCVYGRLIAQLNDDPASLATLFQNTELGRVLRRWMRDFENL